MIQIRTAANDGVGSHPTTTTTRPSVLVADDQADVLLALRLALKGEGFDVETADSPSAIVAAVGRRRFDVLIMDLNYTRDTTSGAEGLELLPRLRDLDEGLAIMVMTAWGTIELAVEAMRRGAGDFLLKPWDNAALVRTVRALAHSRRREHVTRPRDLDLARRVQTRLLPQSLPTLATLECAARCVEAGAVGGDGYDFLDIGQGQLALVLADACGKGVAAALLWANLQATLRSQAARAAEDLPGLLAGVNQLFCASTDPEHFATLFLGVYDDATRHLRYMNCGHNPPLLLRASGALERLPATAPVVGLLESWEGVEAEIVLRPGDTLLLYSDGVTEAHNAAGEEFGEMRLGETLRHHCQLAVAELPGALVSAVDAFTGGVHEDDATLVAARVR